MTTDEYKRIFRAEEWFWWFTGMGAITRAVIRRFCPQDAPLDILDAGCGTGGAMRFLLSDYGAVTGVDKAVEAISFSRQRGLTRLARGSLTRLPFADESFDLATSFDVLYHRWISDDVAALREMGRVLRPGGRVLLRLPAYEWLRGRHDIPIYTARRYTTTRVARCLANAGLAPEHLSYANTLLFPAAVAVRLMKRFLGGGSDSDLPEKPSLCNGLFAALLRAEAPLVAGPGLPFGLTVVAVGRKPV